MRNEIRAYVEGQWTVIAEIESNFVPAVGDNVYINDERYNVKKRGFDEKEPNLVMLACEFIPSRSLQEEDANMFKK